MLDDLGDAERLDAALRRGADVSEVTAGFAAFLGRLHAATRDEAGLAVVEAGLRLVENPPASPRALR